MRVGIVVLFQVLLYLIVAVGSLQGAVIEAADPTTVTHTLTSGQAVYGITDLGGAYINFLSLNGGPNLVAAGFGRGWQGAIRDRLHSGAHNPTQAGFRDGGGAPSTVLLSTSGSSSGNRLRVLPFEAPLFVSPFYDFIEHEDLYPDNFNITLDGNVSDQDGFLEVGLTEADEIGSEFDYQSFLEDASALSSLGIPILRHVYDFDFKRPEKQIFQFGSAGMKTDGTPPLISNAFVNDISPNVIAGLQAATPTDYSFAINSYSLRIRWTQGYHTFMWADSSGAWQADSVTVCNVPHNVRIYGDSLLQVYDGNPNQFIGGAPSQFKGTTDRPYVLLSTGSDPDTSHAVGIFLPPLSPCNAQMVVGVETAGGLEVYREDRRMRILGAATRRACGFLTGTPVKTINDTTLVENDFTSLSVHAYLTGLLAPGHGRPGIHERLRMDLYLLLGSPNEIRQAILELQMNGLQNSDCDMISTLVDAGERDVPETDSVLRINGVFPNPTHAATRIAYRLTRRTSVQVEIFDVAGRRLTSLVDGTQPPGTHSVLWNGRDHQGHEVAAGIYFVRITSEGQKRARAITVLR